MVHTLDLTGATAAAGLVSVAMLLLRATALLALFLPAIVVAMLSSSAG